MSEEDDIINSLINSTNNGISEPKIDNISISSTEKLKIETQPSAQSTPIHVPTKTDNNEAPINQEKEENQLLNSVILTNDDNVIDDIEFNIPEIDYEPSLESVLQELDLDSVSDDGHEISNESTSPPQLQQLGGLVEGSDSVSIISKSSESASRSSARSSTRMRNLHAKKHPNSILRHVLLKGLTSSLNSAHDKIGSGSPTCIALSTLVALGTSHGFVLVFDVEQRLKYCLGDSSRSGGGGVSSLAISPNGLRLLVGFERGTILMYDLTNGKLLRNIQEGHAVGTAVLTLRFTDDLSLGLCGDSGGSVFELNFKRTVGMRSTESSCIFSGSRGEVCTFEPLLLSSYPNHPLHKISLLALATLSKMILVSIRPSLKVLSTSLLPSDPSTLPHLSWEMVVIQTMGSGRVVDPVLTYGRSNVIYFSQVTTDGRNIQLIPLRTLRLGYKLLGMRWVNSRTLATIDLKERLRVIDVRSEEELESVDLCNTALVYASSHFKGLATGGNVSKAFALAGERACYNSILSHSNQLVILGTKSVHALTLRSWHERLDYLVKINAHLEALSLAHELMNERAKGAVGLRGSRDSKKLIVRDKMLYILEHLVNRVPVLNFMEDLNSAKLKYFDIISNCVNYYVLLEHIDAIYGKLYDHSCLNPLSKSAYFDSLEPFILSDNLTSIPPSITQELLNYLDESGKYPSLEAVLLHLDISCIDIHLAMKLGWAHGLYDAILSISNRGMGDWVGVAEELLGELHSAISTQNELSSSQVRLGNKLLVYMSCCLAGRAYPYGDIPTSDVGRVHSEIFQLLISLHTKNSGESELSYPHLRTLLQFDTREFLNVLSLSFEEGIFRSELGKRQKQRIVDILLQVMVEHGNFTPSQVGLLFTFLARQMAKPESTLFVSKLLFDQVLEHLTSAHEVSQLDERQQALIELIQAGGLTHFDHATLLQKSLNAQFYRAAELLYERSGDYDKIIECYLKDTPRSAQVFSFLMKLFSLFPTKKEHYQLKIMNYLEQLVLVDHRKFAQVAYLHFGNCIGEMVRKLEGKEEVQYKFLQGIFYTREENQNNLGVDIYTTEKYISLMAIFNSTLVSPFLKSIDSYRTETVLEICRKHNLVDALVYLLEKDGKIHEAFELMIKEFELKLDQILVNVQKSEGGNGSNFLTSLPWSQLQANFLVLVQFCQRSSLKLDENERKKLWLPLLTLILTPLNSYGNLTRDEKSNGNLTHDDKNSENRDANLTREDSKNMQKSSTPFSSYDNLAHDERSNGDLTHDGDFYGNLTHGEKSNGNLTNKENSNGYLACELVKGLNEMNKHLLGSMMGHVSYLTIVDVLIKNPSYEGATFGQIKNAVIGMLETCTYEEVMIELVKKITEKDVYDKITSKLSLVKKGLSVPSKNCHICSLLSSTLTGNLVIFACGHTYHESCLELKNLTICFKCFDETESNGSIRNNSFTNILENNESIEESEKNLLNDEEPLSDFNYELKLKLPFKVSLKEF